MHRRRLRRLRCMTSVGRLHLMRAPSAPKGGTCPNVPPLKYATGSSVEETHKRLLEACSRRLFPGSPRLARADKTVNQSASTRVWRHTEVTLGSRRLAPAHEKNRQPDSPWQNWRARCVHAAPSWRLRHSFCCRFGQPGTARQQEPREQALGCSRRLLGNPMWSYGRMQGGRVNVVIWVCFVAWQCAVSDWHRTDQLFICRLLFSKCRETGWKRSRYTCYLSEIWNNYSAGKSYKCMHDAYVSNLSKKRSLFLCLRTLQAGKLGLKTQSGILILFCLW